LAALKKDADEKRKTLILLFSPAFILKIQLSSDLFAHKKPDDFRHPAFQLAEREALEPMLSRNIIKLQITDNHILSKAQSKSKSF